MSDEQERIEAHQRVEVRLAHELTERKTSFRVKGHTLRHEGDAFHKPGCTGCSALHAGGRTRDNHGHGKCSCGEFGPCVDSTAARKRWHREHKRAVVAAQETAELDERSTG